MRGLLACLVAALVLSVTAQSMPSMTPASAEASSPLPPSPSPSPSPDQAPAPPPAVCPSGVDKAPTHVVLVVGPARVAKASSMNASAPAAAGSAAAPLTAYTPAIVVNGSLVGPRLDFTAGEDVSVDVTNLHPTEPTAIHWHGLTMADTPGNGLGLWSDGVDSLTQASIPPGATFRYRFKALGGGGEAGGTHWWHAHYGAQYGDGVRGPLVIHPKRGGGAQAGRAREDERLLFISDSSDALSSELMKALESGGMGAGAGGGGMSPMGGGGGGAMAGMAHGRKLRAGDEEGGGAVAGMPGMGAAAPAPAPPAAHGTDAAAAAPAAAGAPAHGGGGSAVPAMGEAGAAAPACPPVPDLSDFPFYGTLVNGRGYALADASKGVAGVQADGAGLVGAPAVITVRKGATHRIRIVQAAASWGYNISVAGHVWPRLVALDGYPVELGGPAAQALVRGGSIILQPGETADVELVADAPVGNYWIRVATGAGPGGAAVLHYDGAPDPAADPALGPPPLAYPRGACPAAGGVPGVVDLKNATGVRAGRGEPRPPRAAARTLGFWLSANAGDPAKPANLTIPGFALAAGAPPPPPGCEALAADGASADGTGRAAGAMPPPMYCWGINWLVYTPPPTLPVLAGNQAAPGGAAATAGSASTSSAGTAVPGTRLAADEVVDLLFVNPTSMAHPMHLHGRGFWWLGSGHGDLPLVGGGGAINVEDARLNMRDPPRRNTIPVAAALPGEPGPAWAVVRMSQGPGIVPMHCHLEPHVASGMMTYFVVGEAWAVPDNLACAGVARVAVDGSGGPVLSPYAA